MVTSLSDEVTEGSPEAFRPTVLYRSDESLRVASVCVVSQDGGVCFAPNRSAGRKVRGPTVPVQIGDADVRRSDRLHKYVYSMRSEAEDMCIDPVSTTPVTRVLTYSANASDCTFT